MADSYQSAEDAGRPERALFISTRTILLVGLAVALAWALSSIGHILLLILISIFGDSSPSFTSTPSPGRSGLE